MVPTEQLVMNTVPNEPSIMGSRACIVDRTTAKYTAYVNYIEYGDLESLINAYATATSA